MVILKDENSKLETATITNKEIEESPSVVPEFYSQWQQPPSHYQWHPPPPPPPPPSYCQVDSPSFVVAPDYGGQLAPISGHQWQYASSSSSIPQGGYQWQHNQQSLGLIHEPQWLYGQGRSGLMPNQWGHHYHPGGSSNPSSSYDIFAQRPQPQQGYDIFERAQQGVNPTHFASTENTMFGNDQEHLRFSELGNVAATLTPTDVATTNMPVNVGPIQSRSTTFDVPNSSRSEPVMLEMPAPGPSKPKQRTSETSCSSNTIPPRSDVPGVSSTSRRRKTDNAGKQESPDNILAKALKSNINEAIATLMRRIEEENEQNRERRDIDETAPQGQNGEEEENVGGKEEAGNGAEESNEVLNPTPLNFVASKNCGSDALSLELREPIQKANGKTRQRNKASLVGKEHTSFSNLPDSVMHMVNDSVAKWNGTYRYTLSQRLDGWLIERRQRINGRYDSYYHHMTSGQLFRSIVEMARFILREEYPPKGKGLTKEDVVPMNQELLVHNGEERSTVDRDLTVELEEGGLGQDRFTIRIQSPEVESNTSHLSTPLKPSHKGLKRKIESVGCDAALEETATVSPPQMEIIAPDSTVFGAQDLPVLADSSAAAGNLETFMQQLSALDVVLSAEMNDIDFTYGANHVFDDGDHLIDHIETCESLEDLNNFLRGNNGKKSNNNLP